MALRLVARRSVSPSTPLVLKLTTTGDISIIRRDRCASYSSSSSPLSSSLSSSPLPNEKVTDDRLASVIEAVNDRKLPPELRGQRNNVRSETDIINVVEQRVWHAREEGKFENLPGKGKYQDVWIQVGEGNRSTGGGNSYG